MQQLHLISTETTEAILPLIPLIIKGVAAGAKHIGAKKAIAKGAKHKVSKKKHHRKKRRKDNDEEE